MKYAICNETFGGWEHGRICEYIAGLGYTGLEVAPFTLAEHFRDISGERLNELKRQASAAGVTILGLHWLLKGTTGLHLTTPDIAVQKRTGDYLAALAEACAELGGGVLVLGSPQQRSLLPGVTTSQADEHAIRTISHCLATLERTAVTLALEPLGTTETDWLNRAADAVNLINRIGHANVKLHLDVKAMADEAAPAAEVIRANAAHLAHFHANDPNRRGPGFGDADFRPILAALEEIKYQGWVSVEVFDYSPDPETIASRSLDYLKMCES